MLRFCRPNSPGGGALHFRSGQLYWKLDVCRPTVLLETNRCCPARMVESFAAIDAAVSSSRRKCYRILNNFECFRQLLDTPPILKSAVTNSSPLFKSSTVNNHSVGLTVVGRLTNQPDFRSKVTDIVSTGVRKGHQLTTSCAPTLASRRRRSILRLCHGREPLEESRLLVSYPSISIANLQRLLAHTRSHLESM